MLKEKKRERDHKLRNAGGWEWNIPQQQVE